MLNNFLDFIKSKKLCDKADNILVAVSGGVDSVVLAKLFKEAGFDFAVAHCNFQLRGPESDADEAFVIDFAKRNEIQHFTTTFDSESYAAKHNISIQMAARELRYNWFEQLTKAEGFDYIATAHHLDDSFETAIFNLTKGTGISGLRGILPKQNKLIRPLLFTTKDEIIQFAQETGISWREDSSNIAVKYSRNLIRQEVMPLLKKINPALESTFYHTQQRLMETETILKDKARAFLAKNSFSKGRDIFFSRKELASCSAVLTEELLKPYGFNFFQARDIFAAAISSEATGKIFLSDAYQVNIDRESIIISEATKEITDQFISPGDKEAKNEILKLELQIVENKTDLHTQKNAASLDLRRLDFPLKLRKWKQGDTFHPLGMKGKKKLSDFMIDEKIPLNLKERVCVLESKGQVVWIIGYRIDERFKVRTGTTKILNIVKSDND